MKLKNYFKNIILYILTPAILLVSCKSNETDDDSSNFVAKFTFEKNLATNYMESIPLEFEIKNKDIVKVELFFQDSLLGSWKNPNGKYKIVLDTKKYSLGSYQLQLKSYFNDGDSFFDTRLLRILSNIQPEEYETKIVKTFPHNENHFTQGLEFDGDKFYEGTGDPGGEGATKLMEIELNSGKILREMGLEAPIFGEGITIFGDKIYQLTYKDQKCLVYDKNTFKLLKEFTYSGEGWGLCNDGKYLLMSNGTEYITFRDAENFQIVKSIQVFDQVGPRTQINELEYVDGKIYANIWMLNLILEIDPSNGSVLKEIDCNEISSIGKGNGDVLNGIAYHAKSKNFYLTGKYWKNIFQVTFVKK